MTAVRPGFTFTDAHKLDLQWTPGRGQKWADAPNARCIVTRVTKTLVFYRYADSLDPAGVFRDDRRAFERAYLTPES